MLNIDEPLKGAIDIFYTTPPVLETDLIGKLEEHLQRLGRHYQFLHAKAVEEGQARWKNTIKIHYMLARLEASMTNPTYTQGYMSESLVGEARSIYEQSLNGPYRPTIHRVMLLTNRIGMKPLWV